MAHNILLTSLSAMESDLPVRYFSVQNESGVDYFDVLLDAEAGIKSVLSRYDIDEVIVIGGAGSCGEGDATDSAPLRHGSSLSSSDKPLSTYGLLQQRIALYAEGSAGGRKEEDEGLPGEVREKLIRFIRDFREKNAELKAKESGLLFDALARSEGTCESFWTALFEACPELRDDQGPCRRWVKRYLYEELEPSLKPGLLPANEGVRLSFIPETEIDDSGRWVDNMMAMNRSIVKDEEDIDLYISLNSDDAADTFIVLNMLDILISMPESGVHLKKIFTVRSLHRRMAGIIRDDTEGFGLAELFHGIRVFLNYGKADMIADIWKKSGESNESIAAMVDAMRSVDVGLSMCNMPEVKDGILRLRNLFRSEKFWRESGYYGMLFSLIAESIREDYGVLLEGDGRINFIEMVKWAYRHQFYQQTLTLIESDTPEELVRSGIFYYCNDEANVDHVTDLLAQQRLQLRPHEYFKMDEIDHYFIKSYGRSQIRRRDSRGRDPQRVYAEMRTQSVGNQDPSVITGYTACDSTDTLQDALFAYYRVGYVRNKISHADAHSMENRNQKGQDGDEVSALVWMKDSIELFIGNYEKAAAEVQGKDTNVIIITSGDVRRKAESMRPDRRPERGRNR